MDVLIMVVGVSFIALSVNRMERTWRGADELYE